MSVLHCTSPEQQQQQDTSLCLRISPSFSAVSRQCQLISAGIAGVRGCFGTEQGAEVFHWLGLLWLPRLRQGASGTSGPSAGASRPSLLLQRSLGTAALAFFWHFKPPARNPSRLQACCCRVYKSLCDIFKTKQNVHRGSSRNLDTH